MELRIAIMGEGAHVDTVPLRMLSRLVSAYLSALRAVAEFNNISILEPTADGSNFREGSSLCVIVVEPAAIRSAELLQAAMLAPTAAMEIRRNLNDLAKAARDLRPGWTAGVAWGDRAFIPIPDKVPLPIRSSEVATRPTRITGHNRERGPADTPVIYATDALRDINYVVETDSTTALASVAWEANDVEVDLRMTLHYGSDGKVARAVLINVELVRGPWNVADTMAWFGEEFAPQ